ncbi:MAG: type III polyketide synthase [Ignavibacteriae bacterium]|nr:type III polyketide synthase [Ignavibacteria bacterium]MBI3363432.1 type III polyketide synthase [Ignavibacteriota bacterium]
MESFPTILAIGTANPAQRYSQREIYNVVAQYSEFYRSDRIQHIFMNSDIEYRHLYLDINSFGPDETPDQLHDRYYRGAMDVGSQAISSCLANGTMDVSDIDCVIAVSCTGYLCPGLSSLLIKQFHMRNNVQRADLLGMGCAGAMPGLQRAYDFVKAYPDKKALVLTVEICSACYYVDDSLETVVGNAICADGAAAVVVGMSNGSTLPKIVGFETYLEPSFIHTVGLEQREGKLRIILSKDIRTVAGTLAKNLINNLLKTYHVTEDQITHWVLHSGGRKVIDSIRQEMKLSNEQVHHSKCVLQNFGNMSSPTVLFVLQETLRNARPTSGDLGVMVAMGPGLAIEGALLKW